MTVSVKHEAPGVGGADERAACCSLYHHAVELVGKRWTGAILQVMRGGIVRFSDLATAIPGLSDRMLSERLKELEAEEIVERRVSQDLPARVDYALTEKGRALQPAVRALKQWGREWLDTPAGS